MSAATESHTAAQAAREQRRRDPNWEQKRRERAIAAPHIGRFEWRIVFEALWGVGGFVAMIVLALQGSVPYLVAMLVNGVLSYCLYMPLHEATHNNVQGSHWHLRWVNDAVGRFCSPFVGFSFKAHQISHMQHHAFTNDPERDPDHYVAGSAWEIPRKLVLVSLLQVLIPILSLLPKSMLPVEETDADGKPTRPGRLGVVRPGPEELVYAQRFGLCLAAAFLLAIASGTFWELLVLYYLPTRIGMLLMLLFFAWLPHHPHTERGRYRDTRVTLFPMSGLLVRGHDRHIIHHMLPLVPHYRIPDVFAEMRQLLEDRDARIEGPLAGPGTPPLLLRFDPIRDAAVESPGPTRPSD